MLIWMIFFFGNKTECICIAKGQKPFTFQATTDSERERHAGIPPRDEEEMEMSDDSSTLTGESLEAVTPTITPRYYLGNNSTLSPTLIYHGLMENSYFD